MLESIGALYVISVLMSVVLFILVVRFLWVVPSSLKLLVSYVEEFYCKILVNNPPRDEKNFDDDVNFY